MVLINPNIGYIIEKMRGDSLTPLGSKKPTRVQKILDMIEDLMVHGVNAYNQEVSSDLRSLFNDGLPFLNGLWRDTSTVRITQFGAPFPKPAVDCVFLLRFNSRDFPQGMNGFSEVALILKPKNSPDIRAVFKMGVVKMSDLPTPVDYQSEVLKLQGQVFKVFGVKVDFSKA